MRLRNTLILVVLLLGLGAYVYWIEYPKAQQEAKKKTLLEFKTDDVTEVSLGYPDREIVLKKIDGVWRLSKPLETEADETSVKGLLSTIADAEAKKTLEEGGGDLSAFGLDSPTATITVKLGDRELPAIKVGKATPVGASAYVQLGDEKQVRLTTSAFRSGIDKKVKDLRDKTILRFEDDQVRRITLKAAEREVHLVKKEGTWRVEKPADYAADQTTVRSFLSTLRSVRALDFVDDAGTDLSGYGLDAPRLTVTLSVGEEGDKRELLVGKENDKKEIFVKSGARPAVYTVSEWVYRDLDKKAGDFRDKTVLAFDKSKASAIELKRADGEQIKLNRGSEDTWSVAGLDGEPAETVITQFVNDVHELKGYEIAADEVAGLKDFGLDPAALSISVTGENETALGTILLGQRDKEGKKEYLAAVSGGKTVFLVRDYLYTRLDKRQSDFVKKPTPTAAPVTPGAEAEEEDEDEDYGDEDDYADEGEVDEE